MVKTFIVLLENRRELMERIEGLTFDSVNDMIDCLTSLGMNHEDEETLGYYEISNFTELVNNQVLDDITDYFISHVKIKKS